MSGFARITLDLRLTCLDTSKYPPRAGCHGKHGEFIASLAALSLLSITSHHRDYRTHNSLTFHNSRLVARNIPALPEQRVLVFASGTRVVVRDLFGSMPVRVKQRAMEMERLGSSRDFDQLVRNIVALLLPWGSEVLVSVQDSSAGRAVSLLAQGVVDWSRSYRTTAPDVISRTALLLTQASLAEDQESKPWVPIGATASGLSVRGCVSLRPVATKRMQFIALGVQPLLNEQHSNFFYEEINRVFDNSSFGVIEETTLGDDGLPTKTEGFTGKELKPRRGVDRWPMFFLQIMLDTGTGSVDISDFLDGRRQNTVVITDLLQVMAYEFLKKHHFRPQSVHALERLKRPKTSSPAPLSQLPVTSNSALSRGRSVPEVGRLSSKHEARKTTSSPRFNSQISSSEKRTASPFASWSRVKSSVPRALGLENKVVSPQSSQQAPGRSTVERDLAPNSSLETTPSSENPLFDKRGSLLRKPFDDGDEASGTTPTEISSDQPLDAQSTATDESTGGTVVWVDPTTKIKSLIDSRTGFAVKSSSKAEIRPAPLPKSGDRARNVYQLGKWNTTQPGNKNPIFQPTELPVPQVIPVSETLGVEYDGRGGENQDAGGPNQNMSVALESRISKIALQKAQIFGQVDQKFILAKVVTTPSANFTSCVSEADRILILIDQHAADERCKVETLLEAYFVPDPAGSSRLVAQTQNLDKAIRFDLSRQDVDLLVRYKKHFGHWGIDYKFLPDQEAAPQVTVEIQALPPSILERCRLEPRLLIDLLRKEIWKLDGLSSRRGGGCISLDANADNDWVARFHDCPEGILDLIHSRACRSESLLELNVAPN